MQNSNLELCYRPRTKYSYPNTKSKSIFSTKSNKKSRRMNKNRIQLHHCCPRWDPKNSAELTCYRPCENGTGVCGPSSVRPGNYRMDNGGAWCAGVYVDASAVSFRISRLWPAIVKYCSDYRPANFMSDIFCVSVITSLRIWGFCCRINRIVGVSGPLKSFDLRAN